MAHPGVSLCVPCGGLAHREARSAQVQPESAAHWSNVWNVKP